MKYMEKLLLMGSIFILILLTKDYNYTYIFILKFILSIITLLILFFEKTKNVKNFLNFKFVKFIKFMILFSNQYIYIQTKSLNLFLLESISQLN